MVRQAHHPEPSRRVNHNDQNSKFETSVIVLVIEYWDLRFVCYLVLVFWDFISGYVKYS
jgi:hypothetical protein